MRPEQRRTALVFLIAGVAGMLLALPAIYLFGLWLAPPRPTPSTATVPPLVGDAIWARADGGRATELKPLNPINFISHRVCRALAARTDDPQQRGERRAECMKSLPAIQAADYLSGVHMRDEHVDPQSWRMGISQVAAEIRGRVLERMRDNQAIDGEQFQSASTSSLGLGPEPANHPPCRQ